MRGDQIEVFKLLNGYGNIDRNIFFSVKEERRTRGHGVTLPKKQCRLDIRNLSFSQRTVNKWNRLLADCIGASSVNMFKNKVDFLVHLPSRVDSLGGNLVKSYKILLVVKTVHNVVIHDSTGCYVNVFFAM